MAAVKSRHHLSLEEKVAGIKKNTNGTFVQPIVMSLIVAKRKFIEY